MNIIYRKMKQADFSACAHELMNAFKEEPWNEHWTFKQAYTRIEEDVIFMSGKVWL